MCPTAYLSKQIVNLGTRSYRQRMEAESSMNYRVTQLARLNRDLDNFYEQLYQQYPSVTASDYKVFSSQLKIMLSTVKALYDVCRKMPSDLGFAHETDKLGMNYSALYEIKHDIENFRLPTEKRHADVSALLAEAGKSLLKVR